MGRLLEGTPQKNQLARAFEVSERMRARTCSIRYSADAHARRGAAGTRAAAELLQ